MDCERLTPYLRRRCLALKASDRAALVRIMTESLTPSLRTEDQVKARLAQMGETMAALTGLEITRRCRRTEYMRARTIFAFTARQEGFTQESIGEYLGLDHSTIHNMEKRMGDAFDVPTCWPDYIELYNLFTTAIL